jgi:hypothetical protein
MGASDFCNNGGYSALAYADQYEWTGIAKMLKAHEAKSNY